MTIASLQPVIPDFVGANSRFVNRMLYCVFFSNHTCVWCARINIGDIASFSHKYSSPIPSRNTITHIQVTYHLLYWPMCAPNTVMKQNWNFFSSLLWPIFVPCYLPKQIYTVPTYKYMYLSTLNLTLLQTMVEIYTNLYWGVLSEHISRHSNQYFANLAPKLLQFLSPFR